MGVPKEKKKKEDCQSLFSLIQREGGICSIYDENQS